MLKALIAKALFVLLLAAAPLFANFWITGETFTQAAADMLKWMPNSLALHQAALSNDLDKAKQLIANGAEVNAKIEGNATPLHFAASSNAREVAALLLEKGAEVNAKIEGNATPLHVAASGNSREVAALLLEKGAEVNAKDNDGETPLHFAVRSNSREVAVLLLEKGADVNAKREKGAFENLYVGATPLHFAVLKNVREVAVLLLANGADINAKMAWPTYNILFGPEYYYLTPLETARHWQKESENDRSDMIELLTSGLAAARAQPKVQPAKD